MEFLDLLLNSPLAVIVLTVILACLLAYGYYSVLPMMEQNEALNKRNRELEEKLLQQGDIITLLLPQLKSFIDTEFKDTLHEVTESLQVLKESITSLKDAAKDSSSLPAKFEALKDKIDRMDSIINKHPNNLESELQSLKRSVHDIHEECHELLRRYDSITGALLQHSTGRMSGQPVNLEGLK